jgi:hypothetical protein
MKKWVKFDGDRVIEMNDGSNTKFLKKLGFIEADVEESEKGGWYRVGTAPKFSDEEVAMKQLLTAKAEREDYVKRIVVEVDGMMFDGDEVSQDRMARSIIALDLGEKVQWVLADNTIKMVTRAQLREALRKAGTAQTAIWSDPYTK